MNKEDRMLRILDRECRRELYLQLAHCAFLLMVIVIVAHFCGDGSCIP